MPGLEGFSRGELPLVPAAIYGYRVWSLHNFTQLRGLPPAYGTEILRSRPLVGIYGYPWHEGTNRAVCTYVNCLRHPEMFAAHPGTAGVMAPPALEAQPAGSQVIPGRCCACGFWAYWFPGAADYATGGWEVGGVIEGTGRVRGGSRGFRAERGRIAALCYPLPATPNVNVRASALCGAQRCAPGEQSVIHNSESVDVLVKETRERLAAIYKVPIYENPAEMMKKHPLTTDYVTQAELGAERKRVALAQAMTKAQASNVTVIGSASGTITITWGNTSTGNTSASPLGGGGGLGGCGGSSAISGK